VLNNLMWQLKYCRDLRKEKMNLFVSHKTFKIGVLRLCRSRRRSRRILILANNKMINFQVSSQNIMVLVPSTGSGYGSCRWLSLSKSNLPLNIELILTHIRVLDTGKWPLRLRVNPQAQRFKDA